MKAFEDYHPIVLAAYFGALLLAAMFIWNPVVQVLTVVGGILFCLTLQGVGKTLRDFRFYLSFFLLIALTNPLFSSQNGETVLVRLGSLAITLEAVLYGVALALMIVGVMLWCKCMSAVMTDEKFLYLFGKVIPKLSLILSMALRLIPLLIRQFRTVSRARKAMGATDSGKFSHRLKSAGQVLTAMIAWSLENAMETASSMKARGYGSKCRSNFSLFRFDLRDGGLLVCILLLLALILAGSALGQVEFAYYPTLDPLHTAPWTLAVYGAFGGLSFLPFILQVKEAIVWKFYRSKI